MVCTRDAPDIRPDNAFTSRISVRQEAGYPAKSAAGFFLTEKKCQQYFVSVE